MLTNPVYTGAVVNNKTARTVISTRCSTLNAREDWICVEHMHEAIVTKEEFEKVLAMVRHQERKTAGKVKDQPSIFSGKMKCGHCGKAMKIRSERKTPKMICRYAYLDQGKGCHAKQELMGNIENTVLEMIRYQAAVADGVRKKIEKVNAGNDSSMLEKQLSRNETMLEKLLQVAADWYEQFALGNVDKDEFIRIKQCRTDEMKQLEQKGSRLKEEIAKIRKQQELLHSPYITAFCGYSDIQELSRGMVLELIDKIYYYDPEHIEIRWNFQDEYEELCRRINGEEPVTDREAVG